jgi:hypothetical protein
MLRDLAAIQVHDRLKRIAELKRQPIGIATLAATIALCEGCKF